MRNSPLFGCLDRFVRDWSNLLSAESHGADGSTHVVGLGLVAWLGGWRSAATDDDGPPRQNEHGDVGTSQKSHSQLHEHESYVGGAASSIWRSRVSDHRWLTTR